MPDTYSTYDAMAKFSEILRTVLTVKTLYISYWGEVVV
jgi:hypothetical protein